MNTVCKLYLFQEAERAEVIKQFGDFTAEASKFESMNRNLDAQVTQHIDIDKTILNIVTNRSP